MLSFILKQIYCNQLCQLCDTCSLNKVKLKNICIKINRNKLFLTYSQTNHRELNFILYSFDFFSNFLQCACAILYSGGGGIHHSYWKQWKRNEKWELWSGNGKIRIVYGALAYFLNRNSSHSPILIFSNYKNGWESICFPFKVGKI